MRVKIIQNYEQYLIGQVLDLPKSKAELLIRSGAAIKTKDMTQTDIRTK